ncbi:MAG TPA: aminotransferase class IV, partial [Gemmatimonadota bacterium]|nr:aminotransferase class IV [Gemmatimonadota bacterium]
SNLFFFESDTLHTPALECGVLPGITRDLVLGVAPECGFRAVEGRYPPEIMAGSDECFVTFTSAGVVGVSSIDDARLPGAAPGARTLRLAAAYEARIARALAEESPL